VSSEGGTVRNCIFFDKPVAAVHERPHERWNLCDLPVPGRSARHSQYRRPPNFVDAAAGGLPAVAAIQGLNAGTDQAWMDTGWIWRAARASSWLFDIGA